MTTTIDSKQDPSATSCYENETTTNASGDAQGTSNSSQPPPSNSTLELLVGGAVRGGAATVQGMVTADINMLGRRREDAINASPEDQWATYFSRMDAYKDLLEQYNKDSAAWKAYDDACNALGPANEAIARSNKAIDDKIGENQTALDQLNALATVFTRNIFEFCGGVNIDNKITPAELFDMAQWPITDNTPPMDAAMIRAAQYFVANPVMFSALAGSDGDLSAHDADSGRHNLQQKVNDLAASKKSPLPQPPPPPGSRPGAPPPKPRQPNVPRPPGMGPDGSTNSSGSSSSTGSTGGNGSAGSTSSTTTDPKDTGSKSETKDTSSSDSKDTVDGGPKISQKDKSGAGGIEGAMVHAQDRMDQIQDRLAWIEDEIGRLETKTPQTAEDKDKLSKLRSEKIKLTRAMQSATEAYSAMMTMITNMMKMYADIQKAIINNMR